MSSKHINLKPRNQEDKPHGYWDVEWFNGGWYKGHYVNDVEFGFYKINWKDNGEIEKLYYAR